MIFSYKNMLTPGQILTDVIMAVGDEEYKKLPKKYYERQIKNAMNELGFDAMFQERVIDIDVPASMRYEIPGNVFNLKEIYAYNGECEIEDMQPIYLKDRFRTMGKTKGYSAEVQSGSSGPFVYNNPDDDSYLFYNIADGVLHLSDACGGFDRIRMVFSGIPYSFGDTPLVPEMFREAVQKYVEVKALGRFRITEEDGAKYFRAYNEAKQEKDGPTGRKMGVGCWADAIYRARKLDSKWVRDYQEYINQGDY